MCLTCGCHEPTNPHHDDRNITFYDLKNAAHAADITVSQAAGNLIETLALVPTTKSRRSLTLTYVDFPIEKSETLEDGSVVVWGPCTTDDIDSDRQVVDPDFASKGLSTWLATGGNIREMHQPKAIGLGMSLEREGNAHWLRSRIVEPVAAKLAAEKVLRAYSVGIANAKIDYTKNPKARGGTIVGGEFVEVSLVDRPANASCKVDLVKAAKDGTAEFSDTITKVSVGAEGTVYKKDYSAEERRKLAKEGKALPDGSYPIADKEDLHNAAILARSGHGDVAGAKKLIARRAKELGVPNPLKDDDKTDKGQIPEVDQEVTEDLGEADAAVHQAQEAQEEDNEGHRETKPEKAELPYTLKRLHDHLCAAYSSAVVGEEYPTCQTLADALDVAYWQKAISFALSEDAGTGKLASDLAHLATTYGAAVALRSAAPEAVADAQAHLRKAFSDMYPDVTVRPSAVTPGRFCRPFITSRRAQMHATGNPRIPMQAHVPDASDFERGYLSAGHAANSPDAGPPNGPRSEKQKKAEKRQFYTNNARDQATEAMTTLHDYIVTTHPEVCPMGAEPAPDDGGRVDNRATASPEPVSVKGTINLEDGEVNLETLKTMIADVTAKKVKKATTKLVKQNKKLAKKHAKAKKAVGELQKLADPGAMAYRGGKIGPPVVKQEVVPAVPGDQEEIVWLKGQVRHSDPSVSRPALEKLQSMVSPDELAEILTA